jgi:hypothetical protein
MWCFPGFRFNGKPTTAVDTPSICVVKTGFPLNRNPIVSSALSWTIAIPPGTSDWRGCADTGSICINIKISSRVRTGNLRQADFQISEAAFCHLQTHASSHRKYYWRNACLQTSSRPSLRSFRLTQCKTISQK